MGMGASRELNPRTEGMDINYLASHESGGEREIDRGIGLRIIGGNRLVPLLL